MPETAQQTVMRLLADAATEPADAGALMPVVYGELRRLAGAYLRGERDDHTLQPTALVHEAFVRLVDQTSVAWEGRRHFFLVAARAMRNVLVDHARGRGRAKRGGGWERLTLDGVPAVSDAPGTPGVVDLVDVDEALTRLAAHDERKARLVELRFFAGMTAEQAAEVLDLTRNQAAEEWRMARAWLHRELSRE